MMLRQNALAAEATIRDEDRDAMHILPLATIAIETPGLRRARMIKNAALESVVELFQGPGTGSGQIQLTHVAEAFALNAFPPHNDIVLLEKLAPLPSFDVYSLRILLRQNDIPVADYEALRLSPRKVEELTAYMTKFTRPLIREIYQSDTVQAQTPDDILKLFRDPDTAAVRERLERISAMLGIGMQEIPRFLEDYGDTFLSLSYFRRCLDRILPSTDACIASMRQIRNSFQMGNDRYFLATSAMIEQTINYVLAALAGWMESFDLMTERMWQNLSADAFRKVEAMVTNYHTAIGGILCALSVKMFAWERLFPNEKSGGPQRRAEFIMSEMRSGMSLIGKLAEDAGTSMKRTL